jgi:ubiquinone/menaquinone biosynthesis C-methylase UbiE
MSPVAPAELRCPVCRGELNRSGDELRCSCGRSFAVVDGLPYLVHPEELLPSDLEFQQKYDKGAESYDDGLDWLWKAFAVDEGSVRSEMVGLLELAPGAAVLEVGAGTGRDSGLILERIAPGGTLVAQDLSGGMLRVARAKLAQSADQIAFVVSNAAYLPFLDGAFDAAYHFGALNTFGDIRRSLSEITRVVRPGGKVVIGDEGVAPWLQRKRYGRVLRAANPLYRHRPPLESFPENALDLRLRWLIGNAFYLIDYTVGEGPPFVDLDLPIPGRGDTLRSRYDARLQAERARTA